MGRQAPNTAPRNYEFRILSRTKGTREVETIRTLISEAIEKNGRLSQGLYLVHIVEHGLETALESLTTEIEQVFNVPVELAFDPAVERLGHTAATHLFYIVREAMYNAARHGGPTAIAINVSVEKNRFCVHVRDNGCWQDTPVRPPDKRGWVCTPWRFVPGP